MGNADLRQLSDIEEVDVESLQGTTVAVDAPNWLYKYLTTISRFNDTSSYTTSDGEELPNLIGVPRGLIRFFENNITPLFVFDGDPHEMKSDEIAARRETKEQAAEKAEDARSRGDEIAAARYESRTQRLTPEVLQTTKDLLDLFNVPYITAPSAAEAQAAILVQESDFQYVISDDYDALLFGAPYTIRNFTSSSKPLECLRLDETCESHSLTWSQLVDVGLLCGTDYNDGVKGVGVKTAVKGISKYGDIEAFLDSRETEMADVGALRDIFLNPPVTREVTPPTRPNPDLAAAKEYIEDTGVDVGLVETAFEKIEAVVESEQSGLDEWTA